MLPLLNENLVIRHWNLHPYTNGGYSCSLHFAFTDNEERVEAK